MRHIVRYPPPNALVGFQLGNYRLICVLGRGGFATIYLGEHIHTGTLAAIKVLHRQLTPEEIEKFREEASIAMRVVHQHIVRVLDFGLEDGTPFLVMEYAPYGTLRQQHPSGTQLPLKKVVKYVKQIARALQYVHNSELIHRDIKPENMLLGSDGRVLISDFGIAIAARHSSTMSDTSEGTLSYMAPERFYGDSRFASDQYALGIVVYEWLCGRRPFYGTAEEIAWQHENVAATPLCDIVPTISPEAEEVVLRALAKDPEDRYANVQEFAQALEDAYIESIKTDADMPAVISQHTSQRRPTSFTAAQASPKSSTTFGKKIASLFAIDILIGSVIFIILYLLGIPVQTFWFLLCLCLGMLPLVGAMIVKSKFAFFYAASIFLAAAALGIGFHSQLLFAVVYGALLLISLLLALSLK